MKKFAVKIEGISPLLHKQYHIEVGKAKARQNTIFNPEEEAEKCLYKDENGKIYQPANHIEGAMIEGATQIQSKEKKSYKDLVAQSVTLSEEKLYFKNPKYKVFVTTSIVPSTKGKGRILIARPRWDNWGFDFTVESYADGDIDKDLMENILMEAGKIGIGTYRLKYGKFKLVSIKEIK